MSGYVGDLSAHQAGVLEKFRERVKDLLKPNQGDHYLLRWLRARNFDLKKAEAMLNEALDWRRMVGADTILENYEFNDVIEKYRTGGILGHDKIGCPIYIDPYGLVDMKGLLRSVKKQDILRKFVHVMETLSQNCKQASDKHGVHIEDVVLVYDLKGLGIRHLARESVDMYLTMVDTAESKYPEVLKRVFVINSPKMFPIIWSIVRPFLHENTAKKVVVLTDSYKEAILKEIDEDQLPACYGGTLTDPDGDPRCKTSICQGGLVPKECYSQSVPHVDMVTGTIGRGSTLQLEYEVHKANSILRYEFQTDGYDVGFGVFRKTSKQRLKASDMEPILSTQRSNSHLVPEDGAVECDTPGIYVVRFDNTYSWARSKKIYYLIEILEPGTSIRGNQSSSSLGNSVPSNSVLSNSVPSNSVQDNNTSNPSNGCQGDNNTSNSSTSQDKCCQDTSKPNNSSQEKSSPNPNNGCQDTGNLSNGCNFHSDSDEDEETDFVMAQENIG